MRPFIFYLDDDIKSIIKVAARATNTSMSEVARHMLALTTSNSMLNQLYPQCSGTNWSGK
jgi:hypothetical protein